MNIAPSVKLSSLPASAKMWQGSHLPFLLIDFQIQSLGMVPWLAFQVQPLNLNLKIAEW
jgi:hypothetical protein